MSTDAAVHGQGIAMGDTMTANNLLRQGALVLPFDQSVPAKNSFYVACRNDVGLVPIVRAFIDWLFSACDASARTPVGKKFARHRMNRQHPGLNPPRARSQSVTIPSIRIDTAAKDDT